MSLKSLLPNTEKVLIKLSETEVVKDFTFVGGSALAVYLNHRKSEDIDLFTPAPRFVSSQSETIKKQYN